MKRVPEHFELDENDLKEAITHWLRSQGADLKATFDVSFSIDRVAISPPSGALAGGMSDWTKQAITAKVTRKE